MKKNLLVFNVLLCCFFWQINNAQNTIGNFRTKRTGNWNSTTSWQYRTPIGWVDTTLTPDTFSVISIQNGHIITLNSNVGCGDIHLNTAGVIACGTYQLSVSGKIRSYTGTSDTSISDANYTNATNPSASNITCTSGKVKFIGSSRNITNTGEWGANGLTTNAIVEFALDSGNTGILNTSFKASTIIISSGIINMGSNRLAPDKGSIGQGDLTIGSGAIMQSAASAAGTPVISRTTTSGTGRSGTFNLNGTLRLTGNSPYIEFTSVIINSGGTIEYAGTNQAWVNNSFTGSASFNNYYNVTLQGTSVTKTTVPSLSIQINGTLLIQGSSTLSLGNASVISFGSSSTLEYNGSSIQSTGNTPAEWPISNGPVNVCVNNANGLNLGISRTISGTLKLTNGIIFSTNTNYLTLDTNATCNNASNSSFVSGPLRKNGKNAFTFPIGKLGVGLQPLEISAPDSVSDSFIAEYIRINPYQLGYKVSGMLTKVSACEYWNLNHSSGSSKVYISIYGNNNSGCNPSTGSAYFSGGGSNLSDLRVAKFNLTNSTWENYGGNTIGVSPDIITTSDSISSSGQFTFGTTGANPLPVKLTQFEASYQNSTVSLKWSTASEQNSNRFEVEISRDGQFFQVLGEVKCKGNATETIHYTFTDSIIKITNSQHRYYRLKQIDNDGRYEYSKIIEVNIPIAREFQLTTQNPFYADLTINFFTPKTAIFRFQLLNSTSQILVDNYFQCKSGNNEFHLETRNLSPNIYILLISNENNLVIKKALIKSNAN